LNNSELVRVLCKISQVTEADELSKHIIRVFDAAKQSVDLLEAQIIQEIAETGQLKCPDFETVGSSNTLAFFFFFRSCSHHIVQE